MIVLSVDLYLVTRLEMHAPARCSTFTHVTEAVDILHRLGLLAQTQRDEILRSGEFGVWRVLLALENGLDSHEVAETLAEHFDAPRLQVIRAWPEANRLAPEKLVRLRYCVPLRLTDAGHLALAMVDPSDRASIEDVRIVTGLQIRPLTVTVEELKQLWDMVYPEILDLRSSIASLYVEWAGDLRQADQLLNLLLAQAGLDSAQLDFRWGEETFITGLCDSSTREKDRLLAQRMIEQLRQMTRSPRPANLGGLLIRTSADRRPYHFLVRFSERVATVTPVDADSYTQFFS
jgi:hypothetical protein